MVKLASVREIRTYGVRPARARSEYMNAGLYVLATVFLSGGYVAQFSREPKSGLVLLLIGLGLVIVVNAHDLMAHIVGIDFRLGLIELDLQLLLVEFAVPVVQAVGAVVSFFGILFLFIQAEKGVEYFKLEKHALNMLIAGPVLWMLGSIHNSCQIYERADGQVQVLQHSVHIPFLMGSLLFLVGAILNRRDQAGLIHHGLDLLGLDFMWFSLYGSLLFFFGGLMNVIKVFKMLQIDGFRLEKLRGGAQEKLVQERERDIDVPFVYEEQRRRKRGKEDLDYSSKYCY